jgi:hypothetical protein
MNGSSLVKRVVHHDHRASAAQRRHNQKPCSVCGHEFGHSLYKESYFFDSAQPRGTEKFCEKCMRRTVMRYYSDEDSDMGDSNGGE